MLFEHESDVRELLDVIHRNLVWATTLLCEHGPWDVLYLGEDTSTTLMSPEQYRNYNVEHVLECARIVAAAGRMLVLHMCGKLKAILPDLAGLPVAAFEAFTSPPLGDTTLSDGRLMCPNTCLIGGTNAVLWTRSAKEIIAQIKADLGALRHHRGLVLTSGGVMPPLAKPETIKVVCDWVKEYPAKM